MSGERELAAQASWLQDNPTAGFHPDADKRHKQYIDGLISAGGIERAQAAYQLTPARILEGGLAPSDITCCIVVRNERPRLPGLLHHYRNLGVARFLVVDNGSEDGTSEFLLEQDDVSLWSSDLSFAQANYGAAWFQIMLQSVELNRWTLTVDADEFLWFPGWESSSLRELCDLLDAGGFRAYSAPLLDLYSDLPIADTQLTENEPPWKTCRFHDRRVHHSSHEQAGPFGNARGLWGGVRRRVFGGGPSAYCLNKVPLLNVGPDTILVGGQHFTNLACGPERGALLHFKFIDRFAERVLLERAGGHRAGASSEYDDYARELLIKPNLSLHDPQQSIELGTSADLVSAGIMGPAPDSTTADRQVQALMGMALVHQGSGEIERARRMAERAAETVRTAVGPRIAAAEFAARLGDIGSAYRWAREADATSPDDPQIQELVDHYANQAHGVIALGGPLSFETVAPDVSFLTAALSAMSTSPSSKGALDLRAFDQYSERRPRWAAALESLASLHQAGAPMLDECVDLTFTPQEPATYRRVVHQRPWVGIVHGPSPDASPLDGFSHDHLGVLFDRPELQRSLGSCLGLLAFSSEAAGWIGGRSGLPVDVIDRPTERCNARFSVESFINNTDRLIVQPGWWMTRRHAIFELPVVMGNPVGLSRAVAHEQAHARRARGLLRSQQWGRTVGTVRDLGTIDREGLLALLESNVVFANLVAAPGDSLVSTCIAAATPILLNRLPDLVDLLGVDYPLFYDSLDHAAELTMQLDNLINAHHHLAGLATSDARVAQSVASSVVFRGAA